MPVIGKMPEWEREDNRAKIFYILLSNSLRFKELLEETGFARSTLTQHLKDLLQKGVVEKALENGRVVYRTVLDEERLLSEIRTMHFDVIMYLFSEMEPVLAQLLESYFRSLVKIMIYFKRIEALGRPKLTVEETLMKTAELIESETPPEILEILMPRLELLKDPSKELVEVFEKSLERIKSKRKKEDEQ